MTIGKIKQSAEVKKARGERLMRLRGMTNLSRADIAEKYGISADTLKNWELGRATGLTEKGARRVLTAFKQAGVQCSVGWLLAGNGLPPVLLNQHADDLPQISQTEDNYAVIPAEIQFFCEHYAHAFYAEVTDQGMEPFYYKGDYVAGQRYYQPQDIEKCVGQHCIVETEKGEVLLRLIREKIKDGHYSLQCLNMQLTAPTRLIDDVEVASATPVMLHRRMRKIIG